MKFNLSKFVGRRQRPGDAAAFALITRAFEPANEHGAAATGKTLVGRRLRKAPSDEPKTR